MRSKMLMCAAVCLFLTAALSAQDAVKADPKHYTVISENDQVRILKAHYGPGEKSVMHSHPANVAVFLTDASVKFHLPGGKVEAATGKSGEARYSAGVTHMPENTGKAMDVIVIELKTKAAPAKAAAPKKM